MRVDPPGFEPGASALQGQRSPSLSYGPSKPRGQKNAQNNYKHITIIDSVDDLVSDHYTIAKTLIK